MRLLSMKRNQKGMIMKKIPKKKRIIPKSKIKKSDGFTMEIYDNINHLGFNEGRQAVIDALPDEEEINSIILDWCNTEPILSKMKQLTETDDMKILKKRAGNLNDLAKTIVKLWGK